ncbi:MAG: hypothetical protein AAGD92_09185 [Pseudomonadota bacterium]
MRLLALDVVFLTATGLLTVWARGSALKVFDWFAIPSPVERMNGPYEFLEAAMASAPRPFLCCSCCGLSCGLPKSFEAAPTANRAI